MTIRYPVVYFCLSCLLAGLLGLVFHDTPLPVHFKITHRMVQSETFFDKRLLKSELVPDTGSSKTIELHATASDGEQDAARCITQIQIVSEWRDFDEFNSWQKFWLHALPIPGLPSLAHLPGIFIGMALVWLLTAQDPRRRILVNKLQIRTVCLVLMFLYWTANFIFGMTIPGTVRAYYETRLFINFNLDPCLVFLFSFLPPCRRLPFR